MAGDLKPMAGPTKDEWRAAMGYFPSGVTVVTTWGGESEPIGTTVSSFCSVSLEPPLLLVSLLHINPALAPIEKCGVLGVNFLGADNCDLALHFAANAEGDRFVDLSYHAEAGGAPQLDAAPLFVDCVLEQTHDVADHRLIVARGVRIERTAAAPPLLYHKGAFPKSF
jgi:flavin reductase (DIM6/NTAB) family NADH-FMN oxidoreductase RutF